MTLVVRASAKINLSLRIAGRRPDGFHDLRTVFQTLALADLITRLDGSPSPSTGHFYKRALAVESLGDRIALLSRGQGWAVARICEALPRIRDDEVQGRLEEMANAHYQNKASCDALVGPQQAGA